MSDQTHERSHIAVVGAGDVGATTVFALMEKGLAELITIIDVDAKRAEAQALDLAQGGPFVPHLTVQGGDDYDLARGADVVIVTAGARQKPGQTRTELTQVNVEICKQIMAQVERVAPDAIVIMVTNPCDVLTYAAIKYSSLPESHIIGSGTVLDSARLRTLIAQLLKVSAESVHTTVIGEHGDTEIPLLSTGTVGLVPLVQYPKPDGTTISTAEARTIRDTITHSAYEIIEGKGSTNFAVAMSVSHIVQAIMRDEHAIMPVSTILHGQYGLEDVCLSVPATVGASGIQGIVEVPLSQPEWADLHASAAHLTQIAGEVGLLD